MLNGPVVSLKVPVIKGCEPSWTILSSLNYKQQTLPSTCHHAQYNMVYYTSTRVYNIVYYTSREIQHCACITPVQEYNTVFYTSTRVENGVQLCVCLQQYRTTGVHDDVPFCTSLPKPGVKHSAPGKQILVKFYNLSDMPWPHLLLWGVLDKTKHRLNYSKIKLGATLGKCTSVV